MTGPGIETTINSVADRPWARVTVGRGKRKLATTACAKIVVERIATVWPPIPCPISPTTMVR